MGFNSGFKGLMISKLFLIHKKALLDTKIVQTFFINIWQVMQRKAYRS